MLSLADVNALYDARFKKDNFEFAPISLYQPINQVMLNSGKRVRPLLLLLACDLFGGDVNQALDAAFAMEVFHNFTLVHDDIMDEATERRGKPSVFQAHGINKAILVGDAMHLHAFRYMLKVPAYSFSAVMNVFTKTGIEIIEGQQMDMDFEQRDDVSIEEYLKMIEYKTSVLLAASLQIGAIIADATCNEQEKIYKFGLNIGLAFQIKDDYLDTFGDGKKVGKKIGSDILHNKKTLLWLTAFQDADNVQKQHLKSLESIIDESRKINETLTIFNDLQIQEKVEKAIQKYYDLALQNLNAVQVAEMRKQPLRDIAKMLHDRES